MIPKVFRVQQQYPCSTPTSRYLRLSNVCIKLVTFLDFSVTFQKFTHGRIFAATFVQFSQRHFFFQAATFFSGSWRVPMLSPSIEVAYVVGICIQKQVPTRSRCSQSSYPFDARVYQPLVAFRPARRRYKDFSDFAKFITMP